MYSVTIDVQLFIFDTIKSQPKLNRTSYFLGYSGRMMSKYNLVTEAMYNASFLFPEL